MYRAALPKVLFSPHRPTVGRSNRGRYASSIFLSKRFGASPTGRDLLEKHIPVGVMHDAARDSPAIVLPGVVLSHRPSIRCLGASFSCCLFRHIVCFAHEGY